MPSAQEYAVFLLVVIVAVWIADGVEFCAKKLYDELFGRRGRDSERRYDASPEDVRAHFRRYEDDDEDRHKQHDDYRRPSREHEMEATSEEVDAFFRKYDGKITSGNDR
jgi:hypothetical protein